MNYLNAEVLSDYFSLWAVVQEASLNPQDEDQDRIIWILDIFGAYTSKSTYEIQSADNIIGISSRNHHYWQWRTQRLSGAWAKLKESRIVDSSNPQTRMYSMAVN